MLWRELRRGLESVIWGGGGGGPPSRGGLGGIGSSQGKGLRTLGTVEALMVLTEWHVRNLHFPVGGEGGWGAFDGLYGNDPDEDDNDAGSTAGEGSVNRRRAGGLPGRRARGRGNRGVVEGLGDRIENILEPAWRSDRMSWMLLGMHSRCLMSSACLMTLMSRFLQFLRHSLSLRLVHRHMPATRQHHMSRLQRHIGCAVKGFRGYWWFMSRNWQVDLDGRA